MAYVDPEDDYDEDAYLDAYNDYSGVQYSYAYHDDLDMGFVMADAIAADEALAHEDIEMSFK